MFYAYEVAYFFIVLDHINLKLIEQYKSTTIIVQDEKKRANVNDIGSIPDNVALKL
jgi:hypothetical protein